MLTIILSWGTEPMCVPRGWLRFCRIARNSGTARFVLEQEINAYAVLPENRWRGYRAIPRTAWRPPWRGSGGRSWHETPDFPGVHEMRRNIPQS